MLVQFPCLTAEIICNGIKELMIATDPNIIMQIAITKMKIFDTEFVLQGLNIRIEIYINDFKLYIFKLLYSNDIINKNCYWLSFIVQILEMCCSKNCQYENKIHS